MIRPRANLVAKLSNTPVGLTEEEKQQIAQKIEEVRQEGVANTNAAIAQGEANVNAGIDTVKGAINNLGFATTEPASFDSLATDISELPLVQPDLPLIGVEANRFYLEAGSYTHDYRYLQVHEFFIWIRDRSTGNTYKFNAVKELNSDGKGNGFVYNFLKEKKGIPGTATSQVYTSVPLSSISQPFYSTAIPTGLSSSATYWDTVSKKSGTIMTLNTVEDKVMEVVGVSGWVVASSSNYEGEYSIKMELGKTISENPNYDLFSEYEVTKEIIDFRGNVVYSTDYKTNGINFTWYAEGFEPPATLEEPYVPSEEEIAEQERIHQEEILNQILSLQDELRCLRK